MQIVGHYRFEKWVIWTPGWTIWTNIWWDFDTAQLLPEVDFPPVIRHGHRRENPIEFQRLTIKTWMYKGDFSSSRVWIQTSRKPLDGYQMLFEYLATVVVFCPPSISYLPIKQKNTYISQIKGMVSVPFPDLNITCKYLLEIIIDYIILYIYISYVCLSSFLLGDVKS